MCIIQNCPIKNYVDHSKSVFVFAIIILLKAKCTNFIPLFEPCKYVRSSSTDKKLRVV